MDNLVFLEVIPLKISVVGNPSATKRDQESKKSRPEGNENKSRLAEAYIFRQKTSLPETNSNFEPENGCLE